MLVRLSIKIPSSSRDAIFAKAKRALGRAIVAARPRVVALVAARAGAAADKLVPEHAQRYRAELRKPGVVDMTEKAVTITVTDPVVKAVERGAPGFDMKAKLLAHGKPSKGGGVYVDVPLRHKPGSVPQAMRTAGRRAARSSGGVGQVRMLGKTEGRSFTRELHRGAALQAFGVDPRKQQVRHKRGVHDDLVRNARRRPRGGGLSVRYTTIRRISSRSAASAWWHPGFKARRVLDDVLPGVRRDIAGLLRETIAGQGA